MHTSETKNQLHILIQSKSINIMKLETLLDECTDLTRVQEQYIIDVLLSLKEDKDYLIRSLISKSNKAVTYKTM